MDSSCVQLQEHSQRCSKLWTLLGGYRLFGAYSMPGPAPLISHTLNFIFITILKGFHSPQLTFHVKETKTKIPDA